jgi:signal peptidase I
VGDDEELRARIEAQVASRRADALPVKRDRLGRRARDDGPGDEPVEPRSLEPVRPWLSRRPAAAPVDPVAVPPPLASLIVPLPPADPAEGGRLEPVRPWLRRTAKPETHEPDSAAPPAARRGPPEPRPLTGDVAQTDEHGEVDSPAEAETGERRTGWSRRTLGWLLAPADQPNEPSSESSTEATAPNGATAEAQPLAAPESVTEAQAMPPWRVRPYVDPAAAAPAARPAAEPDPEPAPEPKPEPQTPPEPAAQPGAATEPPVDTPGTDLPRRLAAANAAARERALAAAAYDFPEDDDTPQRRAPTAFVRPSAPRPAGIAREPDDQLATSSPLVTGTAFTKRNVAPPVAADGDEPGSDVDEQHRVTLRGVIRLLIVVVIAAVIATLLRTYVVAPYYIPSASMEPTLHGCTGCNNDHVLVDKLSYKMHDIHRGDVVVFHRPKAWQVSEKVLIKRVIGLPGDTLTAKDGIVYVDGLALSEPYVDKACQSGTTNFPSKPVTVPDGEAFVMGDNRCDSSDSRRFGAIPDSAVIGRAFLIVWPLGRLHWL